MADMLLCKARTSVGEVDLGFVPGTEVDGNPPPMVEENIYIKATMMERC